jgi:hypothetical protein
LAGISRPQYPKNYANLRSAYERLRSAPLAEAQPDPSVANDDIQKDWPQPKYDEYGRYIPNLIPSEERTSSIIFSLLLFAYGSYGIWVNDLYIPGKRSRGVHLHDVPAWVMYGAMICACLVMLSVVADHYDRRNNERHYRIFAEIGKFVGWSLFGASLFWGLFNEA